MSGVSANLTEAEAAAQRLLDDYALTRPAEIALDDLAYGLGIEVIYRPLTGADAHLVRVGEKGGVTINANIPEIGRQRFALAHELGHWVLHRGRTQVFLCTNENLRDYRSSAEEAEANAFAAALLLPMAMMPPEYERAAPSIAVIAAMAAHFNVTLMAAALRYVSKFAQPVMVVFSREGRIAWWRRNDGLRGHGYFEKAQALSPRAAASAVAATGSPSGEMQPVAWEVWFPHLPRRPDVTWHEQAVRLEHAPIVMTLLWARAEPGAEGTLRADS